MASPPAVRTIADLAFHAAGRFPKAELVRRCRPDGIDALSSRAFFDRIRDISLGLSGLGVEPGDRVGLICESRPEWIVVDLAVATAGAVTVPVYPTLPVAGMRTILEDAGAGVVVASTAPHVAKAREVQAALPGLRTVIAIEGTAGSEAAAQVPMLDAVAEQGHARLMHEDGLAREYKERAAAIDPDALATIIYTSGTTGTPKGVMLTHAALVANLVDVDGVIAVSEADTALSFLPLSHALERMVIYLYLYKGVTITFAESVDTIARDLLRVRPTVMTGVPRVYEKLRARIQEGIAAAPWARRALAHWALGVGRRAARARLAGREASWIDRLQHRVADRAVLSTIRARTGGRLRFVVSGGAPLSPDVGEFLFAVGIPVLEGYGLTETAPVLAVNPIEAPRLGTVGRPLPRVALRIADDGEVLARGPNLMRGYYQRPEATAEVLRDGWFHTGDIGHLDADGYLVITDRKKALLVTAGGKNVAPQPIEERLKQHPLVAEAMLVGDRRPFVAAVLVPDPAAVAARVPSASGASGESLVDRPEVQALFAEVVDGVNATLASYEQIKRFTVLPAELSVETGELTPTLKLKRRVVAERWRERIDALYAGTGRASEQA